MEGIEIEVPDREDAACALDTVEARLVRQGQYDAACDVINAKRRIRLDEEELADRDAEIERLRADLVWSVRHGASEGYDGNSDPCIWYSGIERHRDVLCSRELSVDIDGTSESICRAVREARDGVS